MSTVPKPAPPSGPRPERPDSAGKSLDVRLAEVGRDLRRLDAERRQHAATLRTAAAALRLGTNALDPEDVVALAALLDALATGSASTAIRRRALDLARAVNR